VNRQEDLMKVFDRTYKANHNKNVLNAREREKKFINKMFNVRSKETSDNTQSKVITSGSQANDLQRQINSTSNFQKQVQLNNIMKKWK